jgi:alkanesulfonate monooxygenase SsuD/methylene tetrahydromethanopterin reductase-like flavin-dependent oxidoreductase (luciferase family)
VPIYTASITPAGLRCAGEVADGVFPVWMDPNKYNVIGDALEEGFAKAGNGKSLKDFDIAPFVTVSANDDLDTAFDALRPWIALYIGGMGAKGKNFYHDYATRMGYGEVATRIQDLYLEGKKDEAIALVPNQLLDEIALVGSHDRIIERLAPWKEAGKRGEVGSMLLSAPDPALMELFAKELL